MGYLIGEIIGSYLIQGWGPFPLVVIRRQHPTCWYYVQGTMPGTLHTRPLTLVNITKLSVNK